MSMKNFTRLLQPIKKKIFLLLGRAILTAVNNAESTQKIQCTVLADETITDIERFQEYGFESYPVPGTSEALIAFINGNRDLGIAICVHDRGNRPTDLTAGDVRMYDVNGNKITHTSTGTEIEDKNGNKITLDSSGIVIEDSNSNKIEMISGNMNITGSKITLLGGTEAFVNGTTLDTWLTTTLLTVFNTHIHIDSVTAAPTLIPAPLLTPPVGHLSTDIKGK